MSGSQVQPHPQAPNRCFYVFWLSLIAGKPDLGGRGKAARWGELEGLLLQLYSGLSGLLRTPSYRGSPSGVRVVSSDVQNEGEMVKKQEMAQGLMRTL